jgi:hypothetical protein
VTPDDIIFVDHYRELKPLLSPTQYQFVADRRAPTFLSSHQFPVFVIGESPDLQFLEWLFHNGMAGQSILLTKALLAHEVMHVWFDPTLGLSELELTGLTTEEFERRHEIAAYELQLAIIKRDLAAGKYAAMYVGRTSSSIDITTAIEEKLTALQAGEPMQRFHYFGTAKLVH